MNPCQVVRAVGINRFRQRESENAGFQNEDCCQRGTGRCPFKRDARDCHHRSCLLERVPGHQDAESDDRRSAPRCHAVRYLVHNFYGQRRLRETGRPNHRPCGCCQTNTWANLWRIATNRALHYYINSLWGLVMALVDVLKCPWARGGSVGFRGDPRLFQQSSLRSITACVCRFWTFKLDLLSCGQ